VFTAKGRGWTQTCLVNAIVQLFSASIEQVCDRSSVCRISSRLFASCSVTWCIAISRCVSSRPRRRKSKGLFTPHELNGTELLFWTRVFRRECSQRTDSLSTNRPSFAASLSSCDADARYQWTRRVTGSSSSSLSRSKYVSKFIVKFTWHAYVFT